MISYSPICVRLVWVENWVVAHLPSLKLFKVRRPRLSVSLGSQVSKMSWVGFSPALEVVSVV
jgi:hypothetical protein